MNISTKGFQFSISSKGYYILPRSMDLNLPLHGQPSLLVYQERLWDQKMPKSFRHWLVTTAGGGREGEVYLHPRSKAGACGEGVALVFGHQSPCHWEVAVIFADWTQKFA